MEEEKWMWVERSAVRLVTLKFKMLFIHPSGRAEQAAGRVSGSGVMVCESFVYRPEFLTWVCLPPRRHLGKCGGFSVVIMTRKS